MEHLTSYIRVSILGKVLFCLPCLGFPACAIAFTSGEGPSPAPQGFKDIDTSSSRAEEKKAEAAASRWPTFGMSFVVGGNAMDSGALPKPPFPVVILP